MNLQLPFRKGSKYLGEFLQIFKDDFSLNMTVLYWVGIFSNRSIMYYLCIYKKSLEEEIIIDQDVSGTCK